MVAVLLQGAATRSSRRACAMKDDRVHLLHIRDCLNDIAAYTLADPNVPSPGANVIQRQVFVEWVL